MFSRNTRRTAMGNALTARISLAGLIVAGLAGAGALLALSASAAAQTSAAAKPTIVLVHGAFADGTGWQHVIPILQRVGYSVIALQNPLASLAGDVETTKRV